MLRKPTGCFKRSSRIIACQEYKTRLIHSVTRVRADIKDSMKLHHHNAYCLYRHRLTWLRARPQWSPSPLTVPTWLPRTFLVSLLKEKTQRDSLGVHGKYSSSCVARILKDIPVEDFKRNLGVVDTFPWGSQFWRILNICNDRINKLIFMTPSVLLL